MGGSDQWGNIVAGVDLGRRVVNKTLFGLTTPLMTTASGAKMGKSVGGAVWLNAEKLSSYEYWQYWRNTEDDDVVRFLKLFTELPLDEIARLGKLRDSEINEAKKLLATEATALCHSRAAAEDAAKTAASVFGDGSMIEGLPEKTIHKSAFDRDIRVFELFVAAGLATSNGEARRLIREGGARMNDQPLPTETRIVTLADASPDGLIKLSAGRKRHALVRVDGFHQKP
jgi:tyrosyl-tRNA synthetase